ncbi:MAG: hypothetical protein JSV04_00915 [Candidatus Heimdallarchaeota archaeon]|nr:MAG: hypothetical protein JSV04_00915 [Candidatus Heimdallarchaeota archaeon]
MTSSTKYYLVIWIVFWFPLPAFSLGTHLVQLPPITAMDLLVDIEGVSYSVETYTPSDNDPFVPEIGGTITFSEYFLAEILPTQILRVTYSGISEKSIYLEIYEYENTEEAALEYSLQVTEGTEAPMIATPPQYAMIQGYDHHGDETRLFQKENFVICAWGRHRDDPTSFTTDYELILTAFLDNMYVLLGSTSVIPNPPPVSYTGTVVWGIQAGDIISWERRWSPLWGTNYYSNLEWEIADFSDDNLAVLMITGRKLSLFGVGTVSSLEGPHFDPSYQWCTMDDDGLKGEDFGYIYPVIYPLYANGISIRERIEETIDSLPEEDIIDDGQNISGYGKTSYIPDYTPIITESRSIRIHKGTGIVAYSYWYYKDLDLEIECSETLTLTVTNFPLESRAPYDPGTTPTITSPPTTVMSSSPPSNGETDENDDTTPPAVGTSGFSWISIILPVICIVFLTRSKSKK